MSNWSLKCTGGRFKSAVEKKIESTSCFQKFVHMAIDCMSRVERFIYCSGDS